MLIRERRFKEGFEKNSFYETDYFCVDKNSGDDESYIISYRSTENKSIIKFKCFNYSWGKVNVFEGKDELSDENIVLEVLNVVI